MKVILITFSASYNFGALLQAYSLQTFIKSLGQDVLLLDFRERIHNPVSYFKGLKGFLFNGIIFINRKKLELGNISFEAFMQKYFQFTKENYSSYKKLRENPPMADVYITGSDQVFNPKVCSPLFYLDFVPNNIIRASYAASFGVNKIPDENRKKLLGYLKKFDHLSIREKCGAEMLESVFDMKADIHIDPIFLTREKEWRAIEKKVECVKAPYALCYCVYRPSNINRLIKEVKRVTGLKIVLVERSVHRFITNDQLLVEYGPAEFLWLVDHADFVFTTSFHGLAFSMLFHKKVKPIENPWAFGRITNLLEVLGRKDLLTKKVEEIWKESPVQCDDKINCEVERSKKYLEKVFGKNENT